MTEIRTTRETIATGLSRRHRAERRFRRYGLAAISVGLVFLCVLFTSIASKGLPAFSQTLISLRVFIDPAVLDPKKTGDATILARGDYRKLTKKAFLSDFPNVTGRNEKRALNAMLSSGAAFQLRGLVLRNLDLVGQSILVWVSASDDVDAAFKNREVEGQTKGVHRLSNRQLAWLEMLERKDRIKTQFNWDFFTSGDPREPELAGIAVAVIGSIFSVLICLALAVPLGVMTAIYLEEFARRNRWTAFIEVNINNLAAVPSIVFGLLGLAVFLNVLGLPRSAPLVGGMVLALMTLPTIIIAGRTALQAVPPSIRDAALAIGASPVQAVFHHVLPLAMPGILTGTIIGTARALGETAPLLMIGMVAFIVDIPESVLSPATALPVQVFLWADHPERAFEERTAAAILVLLVFVCFMNLVAVYLRKKFETRW